MSPHRAGMKGLATAVVAIRLTSGARPAMVESVVNPPAQGTAVPQAVLRGAEMRRAEDVTPAVAVQIVAPEEMMPRVAILEAVGPETKRAAQVRAARALAGPVRAARALVVRPAPGGVTRF